MTSIQIIVGILLLLCWAGRPILYKPVAQIFPPQMSSSFTVFAVSVVVFTAVGTVNFTRTGEPETLFRAAVRFLFRHIFYPPILFLNL